MKRSNGREGRPSAGLLQGSRPSAELRARVQAALKTRTYHQVEKATGVREEILDRIFYGMPIRADVLARVEAKFP